MKLNHKHLKKIIKEELNKVILEVDRFSCAIHSLGFIDLDGNFIDLEKNTTEYQKKANVAYTHGDYLSDNGIGIDTPTGWIKLSNAYSMSIKASNWSEIKPQQVDGLIEMWMSCYKYSPWIKKKANSKILDFFSDAGVEELTLGDFLEKYGSREQVDRFFNFLMKK